MSGDVCRGGNDFIDYAVFDRLLDTHPVIAVRVFLNLFKCRTGFITDESVDAGLGNHYLFGLNPDICCVTARPAQRLMDQVAGIGQRVTIALMSGEVDAALATQPVPTTRTCGVMNLIMS